MQYARSEKKLLVSINIFDSSQNRLNNNDNEGGMERCHSTSRLVLASQFTVNKHLRLHQLSFFFHLPSTPSNDLKFNCDLCKKYKTEKIPRPEVGIAIFRPVPSPLYSSSFLKSFHENLEICSWNQNCSKSVILI